MNKMAKRIVIALGGNAILQRGQKSSAETQFNNVRQTSQHIAELIKEGYTVVVTHGNGPQVGNILIQNEEAKDFVKPMPLDVCGSQTQGFIGYMIQQALKFELQKLGLEKPVVTVVTQVVVDNKDPAFQNPTKPIGPFYSEEDALKMMAAREDILLKEDAGRGYRRVVPSPEPKSIVEIGAIRHLIDFGAVVIACGGGGIPVKRESDGRLQGIEAVIDKDLAGERLADAVGAELFLILTDVDHLCLNYKKPNEVLLKTLTAAEGLKYLEQGQFGAGSMEPKVRAAINFASNGGKVAVIASLLQAKKALAGEAGTKIVS